MISPGRLDLRVAEAIIAVYEPWLTSDCIGISDRQRREIADLVGRARRLVGPPPTALPTRPPMWSVRGAAGRWRPAA